MRAEIARSCTGRKSSSAHPAAGDGPSFSKSEESPAKGVLVAVGKCKPLFVILYQLGSISIFY